MTAPSPGGPPQPLAIPKWQRWKSVSVGVTVIVALLAARSWWWSTLSTWLALTVLGVSIVLLLIAVRRAPPPGGIIGTVGRTALLAAGAGVALTWVVIGFRTQSIGSGTPPPPAGLVDPTNPQQLALAVQYGDSLDYDSVTHRAADERFLTILDTVRVDTVIGPRGTVAFRPLDPPRVRKLIGPRAKIVPERRAYRNARGDLGPRRGRIVARVWVDPAYQAPNGARGYPPSGLPPGWSYLWIDSLGVRGDTARVVIIPADPQQGVRVRHVRYTSVRRAWETYSRAAWRFFTVGPNDPDCFNVTCPFGCCDNCWQE
jgi:hypothetical protein